MFTYSFGVFVAFLFSKSTILAQAMPMYGIDPPIESGIIARELTIWEKGFSIIFSPISIAIIAILALIVGIIIYIKRKRKNVKKNS